MRTSITIILLFTGLVFVSSCKKHQNQGQSCGIPISLNVPLATYPSAGIAWDTVAGVSVYVIRYRPVGTTTWTMDTVGYNTIFASSNWTGIGPLDSAINYECQIQSQCANGYSTFSPSTIFYTGAPIGQWTYGGTTYAANSFWLSFPTTSITLFYSTIIDENLTTSTEALFSFSNVPTQSGTYGIVSPNNNNGTNTLTVSVVPFLSSNTYTSTGNDNVSVNVTVTNGQIGFSIPSIQVVCNGSTSYITNIKVGQ